MIQSLVNAASATWPILVIALVFIPVARAVFGFIARLQGFSFSEQAVEKDNPAVLLRFAGLLLGTVVAFIGIIHPTNLGWEEDVKLLIASGIGALAAIIVSAQVNDKVILSGVNNTYEVVSRRNVAVGIVEFSTLTATGLIFAGAVGGPYGGLLENLGWFAVGQFTLIALAYLYDHFFTWGTRAAIYTGNTACAIALGGFLLSGGVALRDAVSRADAVWEIPIYMLAWAVLMFVVELLLNYVVVPGHRLSKELVEDNNWGVGLVSAAVTFAVTLGFTSLVVF